MLAALDRKRTTAALLCLLFVGLLSSCGNKPLSPPSVRSAPLSDSEILCIARSGWLLFSIDTATGQGKTIYQLPEGGSSFVRLPTISPDRRTIAYEGVSGQYLAKEKGYRETGSSIWLMSADGKQKKELFAPHPKRGDGRPSFQAFAWAPDGKKLYVSEGWEGIYSVTMDGRRSMVAEADPDQDYQQISVSPDEKYLAFISGVNVRTYRLDDMHRSEILFQFAGGEYPVGSYPEQSLLAWASSNEMILTVYEKRELIERVSPLPFQTTIVEVNAMSGSTATVYRSEPWQVLTRASVSPAVDCVVMFEYRQEHDATKYPNEGFGYEGDINPRPAILDLTTKTLQYVSVPVEYQTVDIEEMNWSSPSFEYGDE